MAMVISDSKTSYDYSILLFLFFLPVFNKLIHIWVQAIVTIIYIELKLCVKFVDKYLLIDTIVMEDL